MVLPDVADLFQENGAKPEWLTKVATDGWTRALVAGLGYLTVARTKIIELKGASGPVPIGFEYLYTTFTKWLMTKHIHRINTGLQNDFITLYQQVPDPVAYAMAAAFIRQDIGDKQQFDSQLAVVKTTVWGPLDVCGGVYRVLCKHCSSRTRVAEIVAFQHAEISRNPASRKTFVDQGWGQ
jgi:hypothetical protein